MNPAAARLAVDPKAFKSFKEFYPFYLGEHSNQTCRRLHFLGSTLSLVCLAMPLATGRPLYSFMGDWVRYKDLWTGRITQ